MKAPNLGPQLAKKRENQVQNLLTKADVCTSVQNTFHEKDLKQKGQDFPGGPVVKNLPSNTKNTDSIPECCGAPKSAQ